MRGAVGLGDPQFVDQEIYPTFVCTVEVIQSSPSSIDFISSTHPY